MTSEWLGGAGMTSDTDDLEQQLRQNLKLRRELGAEVAKSREGMASDTDDLEQLRQDLKLRRGLGAEVAKSREGVASDTDDLEQLRQELKQCAERRERWNVRAILDKFGRF
jgi:multidrug resistance efflux pump